MKVQSQKLRNKFKRNVCAGLALFFLVVIGAGCASTPPPEQGSHIKIQSGQTSAEASWPK